MTTFFLNTLRYGKTFALTVLIACVSACTSVVPSDYAQPSVQVPDAFKAAPDGAAQTLIDERWWLGFKDPYLNELVARSLQGNVDLAIAVARLDEAGASIDQVGAAMLPRLVLDTQVQRRGVSVPFSNQRQTSEEYSVNAQLGWEIDLWGKLRNCGQIRGAPVCHTGTIGSFARSHPLA